MARPAGRVDRLRARSSPAPAATRCSRSSARRSRRSGCSCSRRWTRDTGGARRAATCSSSASASGMVMQVLVLAVQNAVPYEQLGRRDVAARRCSARSAARWAPRSSARSSRTGSPSSSPTGCRPARRAAAAVGRRRPGGARRAARPRPRRLPRRRSPTRSRPCSWSPPCVVAVAFVLTWLPRGAAAAQDGRDQRRRRGVRAPRATPTRCARSRAS